MKTKFRHSTKLDVCHSIIRNFEATNPRKKYISDLEVFIRESRLEDFISEAGETIVVSTIHKAKGKEFDNVFLMLEDFFPATDEARRQLYVAMTRAKQNLSIHLNTAFLDSLSAEDLQRHENDETFSPPTELVMHLTFRDVWLDYFAKRQYLVCRLQSGDDLMVDDEGCYNTRGQSVLKFSKDFIKRIESLKESNYELKSAKVNFIVYWLKEGQEKEAMVVLPELYFVK